MTVMVLAARLVAYDRRWFYIDVDAANSLSEHSRASKPRTLHRAGNAGEARTLDIHRTL